MFGYFKYPNMDPVFDTPHSLSGANIPWMLDARVPPGRFWGMNYNFATMSDGTVVTSSLFTVPPGWLTGPSGTANTNEFPTSGM